MKLCRFDEGRLGWLQEGERVLDVTAALEVLPAARYPLPQHDLLIEHLPAVCARVRELAPRAPSLALGGLKLLSPVANPSKIIGAPINYRAHVEESVKDEGIAHGRKITTIHDWGLFLKANTSLIGFGEEIVLRWPERRNDFECELAVVIGRRCAKVEAARALDYVAGYSIGIDMTVRGPEFQCWRKSVDTYSVLGPWLVTADEIPDPKRLSLRTLLNGKEVQRCELSDLIFTIPQLIAYVSQAIDWQSGDVLVTGTPSGVGLFREPPRFLVPGDVVEVSISGVGTLLNPVAAESALS